MSAKKLLKIKRTYPCSEIDLYDVCILGLNSFEKYQQQFEAVSTKYTLQWAAHQRAAVEAARHMPDRGARGDAHEILRTQLVPIADDCCVKWKIRAYLVRGWQKNILLARTLSDRSLLRKYCHCELHAISTVVTRWIHQRNAH